MSNQKHLSFSRHQTYIVFRSSKFTPTPKSNNIELKSNTQNCTPTLRLAEFFQNKEAKDSEENLFQILGRFTFTQPRNRGRDLNDQIYVLNKLSLEEIEAKSKSNFSSME